MTPDKTSPTPGPYRPKRTPKTAPKGGKGKADASGERITGAGLVRIANESQIAAVPLHYYAERSKWYGPNGQNGFAHLSDSQAKSLVAEYGFNKSVKDGQGNTAAERAMLWLHQNRAVAYAGPLAGYPAGCHELEGARVLVTESPRLITPAPGPCPTIRRLVETMLQEESHDQAAHFYLWASESFASFWRRMTQAPPVAVPPLSGAGHLRPAMLRQDGTG
ncbi:MAG: hypothetical protein HZA90_24385 [Verrucomicrobia bacterium]|nr:hypothetical protein [Verrucomicrobiota bacterium]